MALCINQSGTWRDITTQCVNQSGTWRKVTTGCINQSGTWRCFGFTPPLLPGTVICQAGGVCWIVAPRTSEVSRNWYSRAQAITTAAACSGCSGWFIPSISQLVNPGHACQSNWDYSFTIYWSNTEFSVYNARGLFLGFPSIGYAQSNKTGARCVRAFRCVTY